jgi:hypothetical protein
MTSLDYYAIEDLLTDEECAARDRTRRFVQEEVMPEIVPCHRAAKFPEHLPARMDEMSNVFTDPNFHPQDMNEVSSRSKASRKSPTSVAGTSK